MTSDAAQLQGADPVVRIRPAHLQPDLFTILGLLLTLSLIGVAMSMGNSNASFLDLPSVLMVILGSMTATAISYTGEELRHVPAIIGNAFFRRAHKPAVMARQLMDIAVLSRKKGLLSLAGAEAELKKDPFLARAVQLAIDGYSGEDIDRILGQEVDALAERHRKSISILRRASEIAPAMGLIGTLVGLVQMLAQLDDPSSIGPAMAIALLTTFYGAIMGMVILGPMSAKLERNSSTETMIKTLVMTSIASIARQENPRRLEMLLNSELPPDEQIRYFE